MRRGEEEMTNAEKLIKDLHLEDGLKHERREIEVFKVVRLTALRLVG